MAKVKINGLFSIETSSNHSLLVSMELAGLNPEYNCRDGHCGACRCYLDSGEVEYVGFAMAYTQGNEILPCICRAKSTLSLSGVNLTESIKQA